MNAPPRFQLVSSRLAGPSAHREQLEQLLGADPAYWKAQTPVGMKPVESFEISADGSGFSKLVLSGKVTPREIETLLVLMAARMPGVSAEFRTDDSGNLRGMRLVHGKLEAGRQDPGGDIRWERIPSHSSWIGAK